MTYAVKETFYSLQGEGLRTGRPAVFLRFSGCNLWSGREEDRSGADCDFCDTDFLGVDGRGGGSFATASELALALADLWPGGGQPWVVVTGGEPALQLDTALVEALHDAGFEVAVETNGTRELPSGIDWLTVSPKAGCPLKVTSGDELKLVFPQPGISPSDLEHLDFRHFILQPMDGPDIQGNTASALAYCLDHPRWRLGLQLHKLLDIR